MWLLLYAALLVALSAASTAVDRRRGTPMWKIVLDVASVAAWLVLLAAYRVDALARALGLWAVALFVGALVWTGISAQRDIASLEHDPVLPERPSWAGEMLGILVAVAVLAPALGLGAIVAWRAWSAR